MGRILVMLEEPQHLVKIFSYKKKQHLVIECYFITYNNGCADAAIASFPPSCAHPYIV
jgi:hypothetical protein